MENQVKFGLESKLQKYNIDSLACHAYKVDLDNLGGGVLLGQNFRVVQVIDGQMSHPSWARDQSVQQRTRWVVLGPTTCCTNGPGTAQ